VIEQLGNRAFFSGRFSLANAFDRQTQISIGVSRGAAPSYFGTGGAMLSNVAQIYVSHALTRLLRLSVSGNYAHNETTPVKLLTIETMTASAGLEYSLTRSTKLSLSQDYNKFNYSTLPTFDRYATTLFLRTEWK